jgi:type IV pilus assembly protein PilB
MAKSLPSIKELLQKKTASTAARPHFSASSTKVDEALAQKLQEVDLRGKEAEIQNAAKSSGFKYIELKGFPIGRDALSLIPEERANDLQAIPFLHSGSEIRLGAVHPGKKEIEELRFELGERFKAHAEIYQISEFSFHEAMKLYKTLPKVRQVVKGVQITEEELEKYKGKMDTFEDIDRVIDGATVTDILAILIAAAIKLNSSDIHIEAEEAGIAVRFRIDGVLTDVATLDKGDWKRIISRIKLIASLKINITDSPQDGRFTIFQKQKKIDVRTSTIPTAWGESVVMRILNPDAIELAFEELGFRPSALKKLLPEIQKPNGMIITTGPTGSGKTTTLYAILKKLNQPDVKIITLEDPIEYKLKGINQSQIDASKDYTFADGIRSILRQDPDIVMVGEIRDLETADTAIQASLTGHLLLSTIHTNDAAGAIPRFLSMGVEKSLLAPAISVIMAQRLVRRICSECKSEASLSKEDRAIAEQALAAIPSEAEESLPEQLVFYSGNGCEACNGTGYKGRVGVYELIVKNKDIESYILSGDVSEYGMEELAAKHGMVTMLQDGLLKALDGLTSFDEIKRVIGIK